MLGEYLAALRERSGLTQLAVAEACEVSGGMVSHIESNVRLPSLRTLSRYLRTVRATPAEQAQALSLGTGEAKRTVALGDGLTLELEPDDPELQGALARLEEGDDDIDVDGAADATHRPADASDDEVRFVPDASDFADDGESCTPLRAVLSRANLANGGDGHADEGTHAPARRQSAGR